MATVSEESSGSQTGVWEPEARETKKQIIIGQESEITVACQQGRLLAAQLGFSLVDQTAVIIAIKEVAYNMLKYAGRGQIILAITRRNNTPGLVVIAQDEGPGIADIAQAMQEGYSTGRGLGLGLPGAKRLMDEFQIDSTVGHGTRVVMKKWLKLTADKP